MMKENWGELCEEFDEALSMQEYVVPKSLMDRWNKVKAEGDKLKRKAGKVEAIENWFEEFTKIDKAKPVDWHNLLILLEYHDCIEIGKKALAEILGDT